MNQKTYDFTFVHEQTKRQSTIAIVVIARVDRRLVRADEKLRSKEETKKNKKNGTLKKKGERKIEITKQHGTTI